MKTTTETPIEDLVRFIEQGNVASSGEIVIEGIHYKMNVCKANGLIQIYVKRENKEGGEAVEEEY